MKKEKNSRSKKMTTVIVLLLALFLLSALALAVRILYLNYFADKGTTVIVPDNIIGEQPSAPSVTGASEGVPANRQESPDNAPEEAGASNSTANREQTEGNAVAETPKDAIEISLYKGRPTDNEKFQVENMLPGDRVEKYFAVAVNHHKDVAVYFSVDVTGQTKNLADVMNIQVTHLETNNVIYTGTLAAMNTDGYSEIFTADQKTETVAHYKIEVSMDTSAGNEYQAALLKADFRWSVQDTDGLDFPQTGDNSNIVLYIAVFCGSLAILILLLFFHRRKKEDKNAEKG